MHGYFENSLLFSGLDRHLLSFLALLSMKRTVLAAALLYKLFKQLTPTRCKIQIYNKLGTCLYIQSEQELLHIEKGAGVEFNSGGEIDRVSENKGVRVKVRVNK